MGGGPNLVRLALPKIVQAAGAASGIAAASASSSSCSALEPVVREYKGNNFHYKENRGLPDAINFQNRESADDEEWTYLDDNGLALSSAAWDAPPSGEEIMSAMEDLQQSARAEESLGGSQLKERAMVDDKLALAPVGTQSVSAYQQSKIFAQFSKMLQEPGVKAAVVSLANDPNVWAAVKQNPAVKVLLLPERRGVAQLLPDSNSGVEASSASSEAVSSKDRSPVMAIGQFLKTVWNFLFGSLFGDVQPEKSGDANKDDGSAPVLTLLGLAIIVLLFVVFKRGRLF